MGFKAGIWASRLDGPQGRDLGLLAEIWDKVDIWVSKLRFGLKAEIWPQGWDLGFKARFWASRQGFGPQG